MNTNEAFGQLQSVITRFVNQFNLVHLNIFKEASKLYSLTPNKH